MPATATFAKKSIILEHVDNVMKKKYRYKFSKFLDNNQSDGAIFNLANGLDALRARPYTNLWQELEQVITEDE